jgi:cytochrome c553
VAILCCAAVSALAEGPEDSALTAASPWLFSDGPPWTARAVEPDRNAALTVPGSTQTIALATLPDYGVPDWFPEDHPTMPAVVERGAEAVRPCAGCHLASGEGMPSSAPVAGLPEKYILRQFEAFESGARGYRPFTDSMDMTEVSRHISAADLGLAAAYFSSLPFKSVTRVVETDTVPKTSWYHFVRAPDEDGTREPIGERIIEVPEDVWLYRLHDPHAGYIAYVPPGSIARGSSLASGARASVPACASCHGAGLPGIGLIPGLAGRSPTYLVRQLVLFELGARDAPASQPMRAVVAQLSLGDMIDLAAFAGSLSP